MESLNDFLKKVDFDQDTIFSSGDGKLNTYMWDKNGQYVVVGTFNTPLAVDKFTLPPKTLQDILSFTSEISIEDGKLLDYKSLEVNGKINLHEQTGREGAPKIDFEEADGFLLKSDMITKILRAQKTYNSQQLTIKGGEYIRVCGSSDQVGANFKLPESKNKAEVNLGPAVYGILEKSSGFDLKVWILNQKPAKFALGTPSFSVYYYVMNQ